MRSDIGCRLIKCLFVIAAATLVIIYGGCTYPFHYYLNSPEQITAGKAAVTYRDMICRYIPEDDRYVSVSERQFLKGALPDTLYVCEISIASKPESGDNLDITYNDARLSFGGDSAIIDAAIDTVFFWTGSDQTIQGVRFEPVRLSFPFPPEVSFTCEMIIKNRNQPGPADTLLVRFDGQLIDRRRSYNIDIEEWKKDL